MGLLQEFVHKIELAAENRFFRYLPAILAMLLLALAYDLREYKNFSNIESMDAAQLGRRIADGKGFTTSFLRPISLFLVQRARQNGAAGAPKDGGQDPAMIKGPHPDISNPPVYPLLLAGMMKVLPFNFTASKTLPFWSNGGYFWRYQPDFLIALINEFLFGTVIVLVFFWTQRLFDSWAAWTSAAVLLGAELLWRFSVSGLSTMLLLVWFMVIVWCLTLLEARARNGRGESASMIALAAGAGLLVGLGGLTRYAFGWVIVPATVFVLLFAGPRKTLLGLVTLAAFGAAMVPWMIRNYQLSGAPFGTLTYHVLEGTYLFPQYQLERSLSPDIRFLVGPIQAKLISNLAIVLNRVFASFDGWIGGFFVAGLLVSFRNPSIRRMRYFLVLCLGMLVIVQALNRTQHSEDSPDVNSENLLVILLPLVVVYGVSMFYTLLDQISFPGPAARSLAVGLFGVLACFPLLVSLLGQKLPLAYPPYHPLLIQQTSAWMKPDELMMSDVPWAVAWYGDRQCVWLTLNAAPNPDNPGRKENFFSINDYLKPINALYLTQRTTDSRFVSDWIRAGQTSWGNFVTDTILKQELPADFPLRQMPTGYLPEQLFLADWKRWR